MLTISTSKTANRIIETLLIGSATAAALRSALSATGLHLSTSGLYKALGQLEAANVVVRSRGVFSVSTEWKRNVSELLSREVDPGLEEGESVSFDVGSAAQMDKLWKHYAFLLEHESVRTGLFCYNPHEFWIYIPDRTRSEEDFFSYMKQRKIPFLYTIGYPTAIDRAFVKKYSGGTFQVNFEKVPIFSDLDNISVFGDYILNGKIDKPLFAAVHRAYEESKDTAELARQVASFVEKPHQYRFKLERNAKKAERLRKRLGKHFVLPAPQPKRKS